MDGPVKSHPRVIYKLRWSCLSTIYNLMQYLFLCVEWDKRFSFTNFKGNIIQNQLSKRKWFFCPETKWEIEKIEKIKKWPFFKCKTDEPITGEWSIDRTRKDQTRKDRTRKDWTRKGQTRKDRTRIDQTGKDQTRKGRTRKDWPRKDRTRKDQTRKDQNYSKIIWSVVF